MNCSHNNVTSDTTKGRCNDCGQEGEAFRTVSTKGEAIGNYIVSRIAELVQRGFPKNTTTPKRIIGHDKNGWPIIEEVRCKHGVILTYDDCLNCDKRDE